MIHPYSLNGSTAHTKMEHREIQEERGKEPEEESSEEHFLKDLYIFMKKRDTPIERIPHLGFKQIDLYVMFKTVKELGGYHQVTAQQLWKQVYNTLGGNPRSTSAATCTRRHYEKLLLPYECHLKGVLMNVLPQHQPKHFGFAPYGKDDDDGQRAAKRKLLSLPLHQNPHGLQLDHPHPSVFPTALHHPHYYSSHAILPPYIPIPPPLLPPSAAQHRFSFHPPRPSPSPTDPVKEPLEQLRFLAEQYKSSSGLSEPLNLSVKGAGPRAASSAPASSFAPPPSSTNPKFLNTPSPLYAAARYAQVASGEAGQARDDEEDSGEEAGYVVDLRDKSGSSSPGRSSDEGAATAAAASRKRSSPAADSKTWQREEEEEEEREGSPEARRPEPGQMRRGPPPDSKMEIEIPISVFHNWLRLYGAAKQLPPLFQEQLSGQSACFNKRLPPANLTFHINSQHHERSAAAAAAAEDLRLRKRSVPSPTWSSNHLNTSQHHFTSYKSSSAPLKGAAGRDVYLFDRQDINKSSGSKAPHCWNGRDKEGRASPARANNDCSSLAERDPGAPKACGGEGEQGGRRSETPPSAVLMVNSGSASLLQLTTEEVMKLKKIISSSS